MKKVLVLIASVLAALLASCGDEGADKKLPNGDRVLKSQPNLTVVPLKEMKSSTNDIIPQ